MPKKLVVAAEGSQNLLYTTSNLLNLTVLREKGHATVDGKLTG